MAVILRDSFVAVAVAVAQTRPRAMPLAMITMRKSIHGIPFLSYMGMGLRLGARTPPNLPCSGSINSTPKKFQNGGFTLKTPKSFSVHTGVIWQRNNHRSLWICVRANFGHGNHLFTISWRHRFQNASFSKCFPSTHQWIAGVFKFFECRFEERFQKVSFPWRISVDGRPNRRSKDAFSIPPA